MWLEYAASGPRKATSVNLGKYFYLDWRVDVVDDQLLTEHHTEGRSVDFKPHRYDQSRQGMTAHAGCMVRKEVMNETKLLQLPTSYLKLVTKGHFVSQCHRIEPRGTVWDIDIAILINSIIVSAYY